MHSPDLYANYIHTPIITLITLSSGSLRINLSSDVLTSTCFIWNYIAGHHFHTIELYWVDHHHDVLQCSLNKSIIIMMINPRQSCSCIVMRMNNLILCHVIRIPSRDVPSMYRICSLRRMRPSDRLNFLLFTCWDFAVRSIFPILEVKIVYRSMLCEYGHLKTGMSYLPSMQLFVWRNGKHVAEISGL